MVKFEYEIKIQKLEDEYKLKEKST